MCIAKIHNIALYSWGCETWSLALKDAQKLRAFENSVMRGYLGLRGRE